MALYHFTLKSDTKADQKKVRAVEHIDYINRDGKYANYDLSDKTNLDNIITSEKIPDVFHGTPAVLYRSPYGKISNTEKGVAVYQTPSIDTISIALMVAQEKMNAPLAIYGSKTFKENCISAAVIADLPITFVDKTMQKRFMEKKTEEENKRRRFEKNGGRYSYGVKNFSDSDLGVKIYRVTNAPTVHSLKKIQDIPNLNSKLIDKKSTAALSSNPHKGEKNQNEVGVDRDPALQKLLKIRRLQKVRPDFRAGRRNRARQTAKKILKVLEDNADLVKAATHVEYINRESAFEKKGGCVYQEHRLPTWAHDSAKTFFQAADRYTPSNSCRYKEFEFALQNELTLKQNLEIVHQFITKVLPNHYYAFAVHDKIGSLSCESHNLHVHLMFSPRIIDDIETASPRKKSHYFRYPLRKNVKNPTEKKRREHGAPTDPRIIDRNCLREFRIIYEDITNATMKKYGHLARIDHRSLKAREKEARLQGDTVLADILHRIPERHISRLGILEERNPETKKIRDYRKQKNEYRDQMMIAEFEENLKREKSIQSEDKILEERIYRMMTSNEYLDIDDDPDSFATELRRGFLEAQDDYNQAKENLITVEQAYETARLDYMSDEEQELFQGYLHLQEDKKRWIDFLDSFRLTEDATEDEIKAFQELGSALKKKLAAIEQAESDMQPQLNAILRKQENPDVKKQIQLIAHKILQGNKFQQKQVEAAKRDLEIAIKALEQSIHADDLYEKTRLSYSTLELYRIIRRRFFSYRREVQRLRQEIESVEKHVLTQNRIREIAESRYTGGATKELRESIRKYKKKDMKVRADIDLYHRLDAKRKTISTDSPQYQDITREMREMYDPLIEQIAALKRWNQQLSKQKTALDRLLSTPKAREKIQQISLNVMRDNAGYQQKYQRLSQRLNEAQKRLDRITPQMRALKDAVQKDPKNTRQYRINPFTLPQNSPPPDQLDQPDMIAQAIAGDTNLMRNVACRDADDDLGMKNWTMMPDLAREEEYNKKFTDHI